MDKENDYVPDVIHELTESIFVKLQEDNAAAAAAANKLIQVICLISGIRNQFSGEGSVGVGERKLEL